MASLRAILTQVTPERTPVLLGDPPLPGANACAECKDAPCDGVAAGKKMLLFCDGKTLKPWTGTANGQYPSWDNTAGEWILSNV